MVNKKDTKTSITLSPEQGYGEYDETDVEVLTRRLLMNLMIFMKEWNLLLKQKKENMTLKQSYRN